MSLPASVLIGPALAVSLISLCGLRLEISDFARDVCFVFLGLGIGAGFNAQATAALLRWPLAFVVMALLLVAILYLCSVVLMRGFGFGRRSAILAAAPGHLSFVLGLAADGDNDDGGNDVGRIAVVQTIRLLALTISVPFVALAMGFKHERSCGDWWGAYGTLAHSGADCDRCWRRLIFRRLTLPAPLLLGAMSGFLAQPRH